MDHLGPVGTILLILVLIFSGPMGGLATADHSQSDASTERNADSHLDSGSTYWQGQTLFLNATGAQNSDDSLQIRRVADSGEVGGLVTEFTVNGTTQNGTIETDDLDGFYVIVNDTHILDFNHEGVVSSAFEKGGASESSNVTNARFEVAIQSLSASFDQDDLPVSNGETATIEVSSNRGSFAVNISASRLNEDELANIFNQTDGNNFVSASANDGDGQDSVQVVTSSDGNIEANFTVFNGAGSYTFDFAVNDSAASASTSVELAAWSLSGQFTDQEIPVGSSSDLQIQSNRSGSFTLNISSGQLSEKELTTVFNQSTDGNPVVSASTDDADQNESIQLDTSDGGTVTANFSAFDEPGNYTFDLRMSDFEASDSANVEVGPDTQQFSYNLTLKNGTVYTMGFPGPINGTYGDLFGHFQGTVWEYDAASDTWRHPGSDEAVDPLDAVIVVPEEDATVTIDFADSDSNAGTPGERTVYTGWNFIGAPQYSDAETSYGATTGSLGRILDVYSQPGDQPFAKGGDFAVYTFDQGGSPPRVSAFTGYWVYVEENGTIGTNLYRGVTFSDAEHLLQE